MTSDREKFAEVLRWHMEQRSRPDRVVSKITSAPIADVAAWKRGELVPTTYQWTALKRGLHRALNDHNELYQRAKAEQDAQRETITKGISMHARPTSNGHTNGASKPINTALGEKLRAVVETPAPAPTSPPPAEKPAVPAEVTMKRNGGNHGGGGRRKDAPEGAYSFEAMQRRLDFAEGIFKQRPHIALRGPDGLVEIIKERFGVGVDPRKLDALREKVLAERQPAQVLPPPVSVAPPAPVATQPVATADLEAAVQLILGAVPGLRTFTITVDDAGMAAVDYTVREVRVVESGGSLRVSR